MQYRQFGKLDFQASILGFGGDDFPRVEGTRDLNEPETIRMLRYAIDQGVNYLDTAYTYGSSEGVLGQALKDGYRQRVKVATKLPIHLVKTLADCDRILNEQLARLQTERIDFYLLHGLYRSRWESLRQLGVLAWAERAIADGRIGGLGFSFHDDTATLKEIIDAYDKWALCQVQYNILDVAVQAGTEGVRYAASKGLPVVIMEPLQNGRLAKPPEHIARLWEEITPKRTPVEWALLWLWSQPEVNVVLSGMSNLEQVQQNIASAEQARVGLLTPGQLEDIARIRDAYQAMQAIPCTGCRYCMPCPNGVDIPGNFYLYNVGKERGAFWLQAMRTVYYPDMKPEQRASACIACRECEEKCSQHIAISEWMPVVDAVLGKGQPYP